MENTKEVRSYTDYSPFQGWWEYIDEQGQEWAVERKDFTYEYYMTESGTRIFIGLLCLNTRLKKGTIRFCHENFMDERIDDE
jgi:hypothetical protein